MNQVLLLPKTRLQIAAELGITPRHLTIKIKYFKLVIPLGDIIQ